MKNSGLTKEDWNIIRSAIATSSSVEKAVLFGSRAMGLARHNSDVDIMLYGKELTFQDVAKIKNALAESVLPYTFDLIIHDSNNQSLEEHLEQYGKDIYTIALNKANWIETTLGEVCVFGDGAHTKLERQLDGIHYITAKNIKNGQLNLSKVDYISENDYSKLFTKSKSSLRDLKENDILLSIIGTIGDAYIYKPSDRFGISSSIAILRVRKAKLYYKYLYYYITSKYFNNILTNSKGGSVQGYTNLPLLRSLSILLPPLAEQKAIAKILSSLDDKIELNNKINKNLEEQAQAIFKSWFVDFEPFKEGEFIDSEFGKIPKGWRVGSLGEIATEIICGKTPPTKETAYYGSDIPFITIPDMHNQTFITQTQRSLSYEGANFQKNKFIPASSICVSCIATAGLTSITSENSQTNQQINSIICNKNLLYYLYLRLVTLSTYIQTLGSSGSTTNNLNKEQFSKILIIIPHTETLKNFHKQVNSLFEEILTLQKENQNLATLRDTLLPKLMSGEMRVG